MRLRSAGRSASAARRMSACPVRARPQITGPLMVLAIASTLSKSPTEAIGNPASITSTPNSASAPAMRNFSRKFIEKPGDCSPSRSVVSNMMTRSSGRTPKLGWLMLMTRDPLVRFDPPGVVAPGHSPLGDAKLYQPGFAPGHSPLGEAKLDQPRRSAQGRISRRRRPIPSSRRNARAALRKKQKPRKGAARTIDPAYQAPPSHSTARADLIFLQIRTPPLFGNPRQP